ncbi:MAG TPA: TolC family protein [Syntrophorhabdaceae bacterium]|nr:TolC family protein [Syntrophorhabdaceae bacterium]
MSLFFKLRFISTIIFIFIAPCVLYAAETTLKKGDKIDLDLCREIALKLHPSITAYRYIIKTRESQLGQAKSAYYPKIDAYGEFMRNFRINNTQDPYFSAYTITHNSNHGKLSLNQNIYDFGRISSDVYIKRSNLESSKSDLDNIVIIVTTNLKYAYYGVLKAKRARDINIETVTQYEQHLNSAKTFFAAGRKPKYDVTKAELDLSNARLNLITAENNLKIAWVNLNNAMGIDSDAEYNIEDNLLYKRYELPLEDALNTAYKERADLKSIMSQKLAAEKTVELAKKEFMPRISGSAEYNALGSRYPLGQGWAMGIGLAMNIFDGLSTTNKIEEAISYKNKIEADIRTLKLQIMLEVQQAYLNIIKAQEAISNTEIQIKQAKENLELANFRYDAGLSEPLEVTDATVSYNNAQLANINALYDYKIAQVNLEKAMGKRQ